AELNDIYPQLTGTATVFPGEDGAASILEDAWDAGLTGVKLHAHVQFFEMDSDAMREIYALCSDRNEPMVMHVGREPKNPLYEYKVDPYSICRVDLVEEVLRTYPELKICVPHLGADECRPYQRLLERYDNLWLDVAMMLTDFFPPMDAPPLAEMRLDRIMFGTDFPNIPYAWDREIKGLCALGLDNDAMEMILSKNASTFYSMEFS
ncbi:MAG: amidohydrolase, partial [Chlorobiales bacterium]|nr:amidohydrolase [Chlorobiales bacterium]